MINTMVIIFGLITANVITSTLQFLPKSTIV